LGGVGGVGGVDPWPPTGGSPGFAALMAVLVGRSSPVHENKLYEQTNKTDNINNFFILKFLEIKQRYCGPGLSGSPEI